jgi:lipoprotein-releasing system permease protein
MQQIYSSTFTWLDLTSMNGSIILIIMSIVAVINLAAALLILIVEQARMVGILKAQGLTAGAMRWVFLYYAGLISGVGIMVGNIIALTLGWVQASTGFIKLSEASYYMNTVPVNMVWWHVALIDIATLVVCILCMWLPTLYIRRIQPARVLQFK